jgi:hypothetical protein
MPVVAIVATLSVTAVVDGQPRFAGVSKVTHTEGGGTA